ncbi:MAG: S8 family serine peptidase [Cyanobacteria bacterium NC_groundwater_1444_Ag_S-0.65um_54_12]|nr:S8 family serine peptidase [Cyanobacteria bacterium NC_groundwater_1444_Ag_S-0.65um_54_12]
MVAWRFASSSLLSAIVVTSCGTTSGQFSSNDGMTKVREAKNGADYVELLVQLRTGTHLPEINDAQFVDELDLEKYGKFILAKVAANLAKQFAQKLLVQDGVLGVEPNRVVSVPLPKLRSPLLGFDHEKSRLDDPLYGKQWYLSRIGADKAWQNTKGADVMVAIVDTGVDYRHPDLDDNMVGPGYSYVNNKPDAIDEFGHGTHVAGIVGAIQGNGEGVSGVAPRVKILPVAVLGPTGSGSLFNIAKGIKHAADYGMQNKVHVVVNLSLGGAATADSISYTTGWYATGKGALLVAAAGNSNSAVGTPARWDKYYMAVSASDEKNEKASFSNFGPEISVSAPGVNILNTTPTYDVPLNKLGYSKYYAALQGTSMACPVVAGTCALVWSIHPEWNWQQVRMQVEKTAKDLGKTGKDDIYGYGLVQAGAAVAAR